MKDHNEVYYKIYQQNDGLLTVVCLQWFDESDWDQDKFFTDEHGYALQFYGDDEKGEYVDGKDKAIKWLNENIKQDKIDPEYRRVKFNREDYLL